MNKLSLAFCCALFLQSPGLGWAQSTAEPVQTQNVIEVGSDAVSDGEIRGRIQRLLREIDGYDDVRVTVSEGVVRLEGRVIDNAAQDQLTKIVDRVAGVVAISPHMK